MLELADGDPELGAGIVIGSPIAWGLMAKAVALRERDRLRGGRPAARRGAAAEATERGDPETESWVPRLEGDRCSPSSGEIEAALALALRNRELTEQLGDVFSRTMALTSPRPTSRSRRANTQRALETVELADASYREAMGVRRRERGLAGDPARPRTARPRPGRGGGERRRSGRRAPRAERGMNWQLPAALH